MNWYVQALRKYAVFSGRSRRQEYWVFFLVNLIIASALAFVDGLAGTYDAESSYGLFSSLYMLAVLIPNIAVAVRRLHDTGRTGWWILLTFVPLIGVVVLLVFLVLDGEPGPNRFGPNPKEAAA